jgi:FAD binding domain
MARTIRLSLLSLFALSAFAIPSTDTTAACAELATKIPGQVFTSGDVYKAELKNYWSAALKLTKPACIVRPKAKEGVATAMITLGKYKGATYTVKSGGHDPNPGHSAIDDGVLIALGSLNGTHYDSANGVAHVKPGGQWNDVIGPLDKQGVAVVGGRLGKYHLIFYVENSTNMCTGLVGVGGYLAQGGLSFMSNEYGFAADVSHFVIIKAANRLTKCCRTS